MKKKIFRLARGIGTGDVLAAMAHACKLNRLEFVGPPSTIFDHVVFVHIPKAAGSSIRSLGVYTSPGHKPYKFYEKWAKAYEKELEAFTVVRNPYTRYISAFHYLQRGGKTAIDKRFACRNKLIEFDANSFAVERLCRKRILSWMHFSPQINFVTSKDGRLGKITILQLESLAERWPEFAQRWDLAARLPLENLSTTPGSFCLSSDAKLAIRKAYADDFQTFGYEV